MNTQLEPAVFQFHTHAVRVFPTDDGLSFVAVAKDVADILGYQTAKDFLRQVPESHKGRQRVPTPSGTQDMLVVDEAGLYRGVLRSNKPEAEPFMEWVTAEVLPSIRRTGAYARPSAPAPSATESRALDIAQQLANELGEMRRLLDNQQQIILGLHQQVCTAQRGHIGAQRGHIGALKELGGLHKQQAARERIDTVVRLEAQGTPRDEIARITGLTRGNIRKIICDARKDGRLPDDDDQLTLLQ